MVGEVCNIRTYHVRGFVNVFQNYAQWGFGAEGFCLRLDRFLSNEAKRVEFDLHCCSQILLKLNKVCIVNARNAPRFEFVEK